VHFLGYGFAVIPQIRIFSTQRNKSLVKRLIIAVVLAIFSECVPEIGAPRPEQRMQKNGLLTHLIKLRKLLKHLSSSDKILNSKIPLEQQVQGEKALPAFIGIFFEICHDVSDQSG
jgi:hypothetical protein